MRGWTVATAACGLAVVLATTKAPEADTVAEAAFAGLDTRGSASTAMLAAAPSSGEPMLAVAAAPSSDDLTAVVRRNCVACHNDQVLTADLSLQNFDVNDAVAHAEVSEKVIHKLRLDMMPPPGMPRPGGDTLQILAATLEQELDQAAASEPQLGSRRFQRITIGEYERAIRDLLELEVDGSQWLPPDIFLGSYDTWSDLQGLSALVVEAYMTAAAEVSRMAVGNPTAATQAATYPVHIEYAQHAWHHVDGAPFGTRGGTVVQHTFPVDGMYVFSVDTQLGSGHESEDIDISVDGDPVALLALPHGRSGSTVIETEPIFVEAGQRQVSAAFIRKNDGPYQDFLRPHRYSFVGGERGGSWANYGITNLQHLTELAVTGPFEATRVSDSSPSRERVFSCYPSSAEEERPCAEAIIRDLATEAYRRDVTDEDMVGLMSFYEEGRSGDGGFDIGVRSALQAILSSPSFLFRLEEEPAGLERGTNYLLSDVDLASRLSFFLWGTVPDQELRAVAGEGRLSEPEVLEAQVQRMLEDPRSEALSTRFASQWFRLAAMEGKQPVPFWYPDFSLDLSEAMQRETELFFDYLVREDRSFFEIFEADYTFVNERLAQHYGIPYSGGNEFRKVQHTDPFRVGIFGHGSVAVLTSLANRTSPVKRGEWVMEVLLGSPPPPPPPNVPLLEETGDQLDGEFLTTRQRMEIHRQNPTCNSCHQFIDPIGLALDHFDPTGQVRVRENRVQIDTRGEYYDGTMISTPAELAEVLLERPEPLLRTFTENLLGFAIGRNIEYYDRPAIRAITRQAAENDYRMSSFIMGVVQSDQFQMRQADAVANDDDSR